MAVNGQDRSEGLRTLPFPTPGPFRPPPPGPVRLSGLWAPSPLGEEVSRWPPLSTSTRASRMPAWLGRRARAGPAWPRDTCSASHVAAGGDKVGPALGRLAWEQVRAEGRRGRGWGVCTGSRGLLLSQRSSVLCQGAGRGSPVPRRRYWSPLPAGSPGAVRPRGCTRPSSTPAPFLRRRVAPPGAPRAPRLGMGAAAGAAWAAPYGVCVRGVLRWRGSPH